MKSRGVFLSVEGIDGSGKTTVIAGLAQALQDEGHRVLVLREPGGTRVGEEIRSVLLSKENSGMTARCELLLFAAARSQLTGEVIRPSLKQGATVICDRFIDSTAAYQGHGRGLDLEMIHRVNEMATDGLKPDLTFLLDLEPAVAAVRLGERSEKQEDRLDTEGLAFQTRVRNGYLAEAAREPERIRIINADRDPAEIARHMLRVIRED